MRETLRNEDDDWAYAADGAHLHADGHAEWRQKVCHKGVLPSIFMPRWASRITLEVVNVRVERVTQITREDAKAEGINDPTRPGAEYILFKHLWDSINGKPRKDGVDISWAASPRVWVVEFRRVDQ